MTIIPKTIAAVIMTCSLSISAQASDDECNAGPKSEWMPKETITHSLKAQGYKVRKVEVEDGCYEVYAMKDGRKYEIYVNPTTGTVVKTKEK
ncbi:hypothetical protein MNBD_ALPHA01-1323 [hydrothermal vent metagenome]|uniref:PepSY domain-containing protein n=1 Tax=hydrothermal vent metagenome TaxID=652676 RepID=A0A3B0SHW5_9ZZZZ